MRVDQPDHSLVHDGIGGGAASEATTEAAVMMWIVPLVEVVVAERRQLRGLFLDVTSTAVDH